MEIDENGAEAQDFEDVSLDQINDIDDVETLEKIANNHMSDDVELPNVEDIRGHQIEEAQQSETKPEAEPEKKAEPETKEEKAEEKPESDSVKVDELSAENAVVKTADGKHEIPFDVFKELRNTNNRLAEQVTQAQEEINLLREQMAEGLSEKEQEAAEQQAEELKSLIERMDEEVSEEVSGPIKALFRQNQELQAKLEEIAASNQQQEQLSPELEKMQAAIDQSPIMAHWQAAQSDFFEKSQGVYRQAVQNNKDFAALSYDEQMQRLPAMTEALFGVDSAVPDTTRTPAKMLDADTKEEPPKVEEKEAVPSSMDHIPGGEGPASSKYGQFDNMNGDDMTENFMNMTPEQQDKILRTLS